MLLCAMLLDPLCNEVDTRWLMLLEWWFSPLRPFWICEARWYCYDCYWWWPGYCYWGVNLLTVVGIIIVMPLDAFLW